MRHIVTTCDICGEKYRITNIADEDVENKLCIHDKTYDICIECENKLMRYISQMKGEVIDERRF